MKFYLTGYEIHAQEHGELMIANLVKETEYEESKIIGVEKHKKPIGVAGTVNLHVHDKQIQERFKTLVGQAITVKVEI